MEEEILMCFRALVLSYFIRSSYEAALEWALPVQFCQLHSLKLSSVYPSHCADDGQFIHFLLFVQLHKFPPQQVWINFHLEATLSNVSGCNRNRYCDILNSWI